MSRQTKLVLLTLMVAANAALWLIPGPVVEYVARDEPTLLGYYSVERFSANIGVLLLCAALARLIFGRVSLRLRVMQLVTVTAAVGVALVAGELVVRALSPPPQYVQQENLRHRVPGSLATAVFHDAPEAARSYPNRPRGFGSVEVTVAADERGFRNPPGVTRADVVVLGDSFVEGPEVDYAQLWTTQFAAQTGLGVYNMGTAGENPGGYMAKLERYAGDLEPDTVLLMIYEGNDFRGWRPARRSTLRTSRLRRRTKQLLIDRLGPVNADAPFANAALIDWLPLTVSEGGQRIHYTFTPRNLGDLARSQQEFTEHRGWQQLVASLESAQRIVSAFGARLVLVYAPSKVRVVLPMLAEQLPADKVLAFTRLHESKMPASKRSLHDGEQFLREVLRDMEVPERELRAFCTGAGLELVSLTERLRRETAAGRQTYYSYDQHWSPVGHAIVADELGRHWQRQ